MFFRENRNFGTEQIGGSVARYVTELLSGIGLITNLQIPNFLIFNGNLPKLLLTRSSERIHLSADAVIHITTDMGSYLQTIYCRKCTAPQPVHN